MSKKNAISELLDNRDKQGKEQYSNTEIQEYRNTSNNKKKATFLFDEEFHKELKVFAANKEKNMVDIVEEAVKEYIHKYS